MQKLTLIMRIDISMNSLTIKITTISKRNFRKQADHPVWEPRNLNKVCIGEHDPEKSIFRHSNCIEIALIEIDKTIMLISEESKSFNQEVVSAVALIRPIPRSFRMKLLLTNLYRNRRYALLQLCRQRVCLTSWKRAFLHLPTSVRFRVPQGSNEGVWACGLLQTREEATNISSWHPPIWEWVFYHLNLTLSAREAKVFKQVLYRREITEEHGFDRL